MDSCVSKQGAEVGYFAEHVQLYYYCDILNTTGIKNRKKCSMRVSKILPIIFVYCDFLVVSYFDEGHVPLR
jgi:hypothetical protein